MCHRVGMGDVSTGSISSISRPLASMPRNPKPCSPRGEAGLQAAEVASVRFALAKVAAEAEALQHQKQPDRFIKALLHLFA